MPEAQAVFVDFAGGVGVGSVCAGWGRAPSRESNSRAQIAEKTNQLTMFRA